jgi:hypothetical protein
MFGGGYVPSDGAQVWARLKVLPILVSETWMPQHVTLDACNGVLATTSCRAYRLCCHSWKSHLGISTGQVGLVT